MADTDFYTAANQFATGETPTAAKINALLSLPQAEFEKRWAHVTGYYGSATPVASPDGAGDAVDITSIDAIVKGHRITATGSADCSALGNGTHNLYVSTAGVYTAGGTQDATEEVLGTVTITGGTPSAVTITMGSVATAMDKLRVSSNDATPGYLNGKLVAGTGITLTENNDGGNETLRISAAGGTDANTVLVTSNDATPGYLLGKLVAGTGITLTEGDDAGDETLTVAATVVDTYKTMVSANDATPNYLVGKIVAGANVTITETDDAGDETLVIAASGGTDNYTAKVSSNDATPNYLVNKLVAGSNVTLTPNDDGADETITIAASGSGDTYKLMVTSNDATPSYLASKLIAGNGLTLTETDDAANETLVATVDTQMSVTLDASGVKLDGDAATPGNSKVYGTDGSGVRGWQDAPAGSLDITGLSATTDALDNANDVFPLYDNSATANRKMTAGNLFRQPYNSLVDNGNSGANPTINWASGTWQKITMTDDATFTFSNAATGRRLLLKMTQDGTGGWTPTWPSSVMWEGGATPAYSSTPGNMDVIGFISDGTDQYGQVLGLAFATPS